MKNQYFGDINDYHKYGLLRLLAKAGNLTTVVCWMRTPDDDRSDGSNTGYLHSPKRWRHYDPELYDHLKELVCRQGVRKIRGIENTDILPRCRFYSEVIPSDKHLRGEYYDRFLNLARGADLLFFDPDNGMEIKSLPLGRKNSDRYLYWNEVTSAFERGHSLLVYQHFAYVKRDPFIQNLAKQFGKAAGIGTVYSFRTPNVVFFLIPHQDKEEMLAESGQAIEKAWRGQIRVEQHEMG